MKGREIPRNNEIKKRLTAILVAVVFVFGTAVLPAEIYAVEPEPQETVDAEADIAGEAATEETFAAPEADAQDQEAPQTEEAAEPEVQDAADAAASAADLADLIVASDEEGNLADIEDIDENAYDGFVYKMADGTTKTEIKVMENAAEELGDGQEVKEVVNNELYAADSIETISEVAAPEQIEYIEPNYILTAMGPNDPDYVNKEYGWSLDMINAPAVWDRGMFGSGATVAVLDSGVKMNHEDFENTQFRDWYNTKNNSQDVTDDSGHGTIVAGILAGSYNNGKGSTGVMPSVSIMPIKFMAKNGSQTEGSITDVVEGIDYACNHGADVINISAGSPYYSNSLLAACQRAAAKGVILIAAAGNDYGAVVEYPASFDMVVSVGSIEKDGAHSDFSSYNPYVSVVAPGRNIRSTLNNGQYGLRTGTSFSAPQVAAMAAMVKAMDKSVNYSGFMKIITTTSTDKGTPGYDVYFGYGLMNLAKAYRYMAGDISMYEISLSGKSYTYDGKAKGPGVTIKKANRTLSPGYYTVTYSPGRTEVGTYNVYINGAAGYAGARTIAFSIKPPLVKSIKAPKGQKKKLTVRWKSMSKKQKAKYKSAITGYQVRVSTSSKFSNAKMVKTKGISKTQVTVKGLKKKKKYYVQYRSYKTVGSVTYYSKWSKTKKARTK